MAFSRLSPTQVGVRHIGAFHTLPPQAFRPGDSFLQFLGFTPNSFPAFKLGISFWGRFRPPKENPKEGLGGVSKQFWGGI